jgi:hypothetical protein
MTDNEPRRGTRDEDPVDTEALGRRLLDRQTPAERDHARIIFQQLMEGRSLGQLRDEVDQLSDLLTHHALARRTRDTRWE